MSRTNAADVQERQDLGGSPACDVAVVGGTGFTGGLCVERLAADGRSIRLVGRSEARLRALAQRVPGTTIALADAGNPSQLESALGGARVVLSCAGPFLDLGLPVASAAIAVGAHYIDISGEVRFALALEELGSAARAAGVVVAPCCGFDAVVGETTAVLASRALSGPAASARITVASTTQPSRGSLRTIWRGLGRRDYGFAWRQGALVEAPVGSERWVASLPAPFGRSRVAGFGLAELWAVGRALGCGQVDTGLAMPLPGVFATVARAVAWLGQGSWRQRLFRAVDSLLGQVPAGGTRTRRARSASVVLAELVPAHGEATALVARCGDVSELSAVCAAACVEAALSGPSSPGVRTPTQAFGSDRLATALRGAGVSFEVPRPTQGP